MLHFSRSLTRFKRAIRITSLAGILAFSAACNNAGFKEASQDVFNTPVREGAFSVTFLGTSSFMLEADQEQVLIDGYVSRARHNLVKRIKPDLQEIHDWIYKMGLCKADTATSQGEQPALCANPDHPKLSLILTLHGHYDHAMDAPYFAGWSGAPIVSDASLDRQRAAMKDYVGRVRPNMARQDGPRLDISYYTGAPPRRLPVRAMDIRLFETDHNENIISQRIKHHTPEDFAFPSRIWDMGEGTAVSALVKADGNTMLIVGSSGDVGTVFKDNGVKADVVFLSIGGLGAGFAKPEVWTDYWQKTVAEVGAKRVFMIHWDEHQEMLPEDGGQLVPTFYEPHQKVFTHLKGLAKAQGVSLLFPPVGEPFDPFH